MTVSPDQEWPTSALRAADLAWAALTCDPDPMTLDTADLEAGHGMPAGRMPLPELRTWLLGHPYAYAARDAVWRELMLRARLRGPEWTIAAVGMAMPALINAAARLGTGYRGDTDDLEAEILTGFLQALRDHLDLTRQAPYASACFAAWRAGLAHRREHQSYIPVDDIELVISSRLPQLPYGHPDLLVERAAAMRLIDPDDVQPWIDVRLGRRAIEPIAAARGLSVDTLRMRLARADLRVAEALAEGALTGVVSVRAADQLAERAQQAARIRAAKAVPAAQSSTADAATTAA
jgi:DNA-directed RNA polymerase specialized sigma24 family protein